jgi:Cell wall-associated hydrolases (invasion-associated proteins)
MIWKKFILTITFGCLLLICNAQVSFPDNEIDLFSLSNKLGFDINEQDTAHIPLYRTAADWLEVRYKWGGKNKKEGVDCSGFTAVVYRQLFGKNVSHSSSVLAKSIPVTITNPENLQPGDMVFFATSKKHKRINHVGIYLKEGYFVHASSARKKVMISTLLEGFYKTAWRKGGRIPD